MSDDLAADIRALADLWRGADHTRQCNARYGMGGCTCGFDARLDMAITAVINHADKPMTAQEYAYAHKAVVESLTAPAVVDKVKAGNALLSRATPNQTGEVDRT